MFSWRMSGHSIASGDVGKLYFFRMSMCVLRWLSGIPNSFARFLLPLFMARMCPAIPTSSLSMVDSVLLRPRLLSIPLSSLEIFWPSCSSMPCISGCCWNVPFIQDVANFKFTMSCSLPIPDPIIASKRLMVSDRRPGMLDAWVRVAGITTVAMNRCNGADGLQSEMKLARTNCWSLCTSKVRTSSMVFRKFRYTAPAAMRSLVSWIPSSPWNIFAASISAA